MNAPPAAVTLAGVSAVKVAYHTFFPRDRRGQPMGRNRPSGGI